jgi:TATA-box binding protein (TBP) (component of TFIID and TFIIIB)
MAKVVSTRYNPDIYHGLVVKVRCPDTDRNISVLVFYTSTIMITGVRNPIEIERAFDVICRELVSDVEIEL